jgi:type II secretory ATPase GspE/PulE/Tfp pilus assembly ATPase PilB-like protein
MPQLQVISNLWKPAHLNASSPNYVIDLVDFILDEANVLKASDIHLLPTAAGMEVRYRIDGVLQLAGTLPTHLIPNVVARLKVLADMITYRTDIPQEGRIRGLAGEVEMRVSTFPTHFGEKSVIRLFGGTGEFLRLGDLGLPDEIRTTLEELLHETSGAILFCGPAGSGKTTTLYTCLRELAASSRGGRSLMTLEDPIEVIVPGVAQAQINHPAGLDLASGLRSMMRQDPEVIAVGEIRDLATAEVAFQASLTGHLVLCTFHAGSAAGVIGRLAEMGIEPYVMISGIRAIVCQRLVRRLCSCAREAVDPEEFLGLNVARARIAVGCDVCRGTGYRGRVILGEILIPHNPEVSQMIRIQTDVNTLEETALATGMVGLSERARQAIESGTTDPVEVRRVLGLSHRTRLQ